MRRQCRIDDPEAPARDPFRRLGAP